MAAEIGWDTPVQFLRSVGPVRARALARLGVATAGDLLRHYPRRWFDRSTITPISRLSPGVEATVEGVVMTAGERRMRQGGSLQTVTLNDGTGILFCVWFNQSYLLRQLKAGQRLMCSAVVQKHAGRPQLAHPDFALLYDGVDPLHTGRLVPQYPTTQGIGQHWLRRLIRDTLAQVTPGLSETLPAELLLRRALCGRGEALRAIHFPADAAEHEAARRRLAYEELLLIQLVMAWRRRGRSAQPGLRIEKPGDLTARLVASLPFRLTDAQRRVLKEILADLRSGAVMHRLLHGDVGAGKTLVALIAALFVIEQGHQALMLAPTEVLAMQHGDTARRLAEPLGVTSAVLTSATPGAERRAILTSLGKGDIDLLVGTHAVLQEGVQLPGLALTIVDEQHRFGVRQRGRAAAVGDMDRPPHVLVMSATPIPRSLSLTLYGDLDVSWLDELPADRQAVQTLVVPAAREEEVYRAMEARLSEGRQGYVIYPVIDETAGKDLRAATAEHERLAAGPFRRFQTALMHGRLKPREKAAIMADFAAGRLQLLVATTVVEVGVDVPNAAVMAIHNPERFGLAQLHQLRGRIGRGAPSPVCWVLMNPWSPPETKERIAFFAAHHDGWQLAEEDLRRRGPGDLTGTRQHGLPSFRLANPLRDATLVTICSEDAANMLASDPHLETAAMASLRVALDGAWASLLPSAAG